MYSEKIWNPDVHVIHCCGFVQLLAFYQPAHVTRMPIESLMPTVCSKGFHCAMLAITPCWLSLLVLLCPDFLSYPFLVPDHLLSSSYHLLIASHVPIAISPIMQVDLLITIGHTTLPSDLIWFNLIVFCAAIYVYGRKCCRLDLGFPCCQLPPSFWLSCVMLVALYPLLSATS